LIVLEKTSKMFEKERSSKNKLTHELHILAADLVTETDKAVEDMVSSTLREKYPDYEYVLLHSASGLVLFCRTTFAARPSPVYKILIIPSHLTRFIGEETYRPGLPLTDAPTFIVDPVSLSLFQPSSEPFLLPAASSAASATPALP